MRLLNTTTDNLVVEQEQEPAGVVRAVSATSSSPTGVRIPLSLDISPNRRPRTRHATRMPVVPFIPVPQPIMVQQPLEAGVGTQVLTRKVVLFFKYVDDNISWEKLNFGNVQAALKDGVLTKTKQAFGTQNGFRSVTSKAKERGMVVNEAKANILCISDALNYRPSTFTLDSENNRIDCSKSVKILGFYFSDRPNVNLHVKMIVKKLRQRYLVLGKVGFIEEEFAVVYTSALLPIVDYCCPANHSMLTDLQYQLLERAQVGAFRAIYGYERSATQLREQASVATLRERRVRLTDKFTEKCLTSDRYKKWSPLIEGRSLKIKWESWEDLWGEEQKIQREIRATIF